MRTATGAAMAGMADLPAGAGRGRASRRPPLVSLGELKAAWQAGDAPGWRPMRGEDLESVLEVERLAYDYPWTPGNFRDCLTAGYCCWLSPQGGEVAGYGVMSVAVQEAHILNLCVHPRRQGGGLGRWMLGRLLELAREHHAETAFLEVRVSNQAALRLYRALGFNEIGLRKNYYPAGAGREDALMLALELT
jgi:[ribosomal protein S18]-alanine N-acetyltransferase